MTNQNKIFTIEQISAAHSKVKSGADFPAYINEILSFGVTSYTTYVNDGHTVFCGNENYQISSASKYELLQVAAKSNKTEFVNQLKQHQLGKTNYFQFCQDCANYGIEKWIVDIATMTCTYFDKFEAVILVEKVPGV